MYHLVEFEDKYVVVTRKEGFIELPDMAVAFAAGALAVFCADGPELKELHLIFYKKFFSRTDVLEFLQSYRFRRVPLRQILRVEGACACADLGKDSALLLVAREEQRATNGKNIKNMAVRLPNDTKWLDYERPVVTGLFEIIYQSVSSRIKSFPEVRLGMPPPEKTLEQKEACDFQILQTMIVERKERRLSYTLNYGCANIEGLYTPPEIWNGLWKGFAFIIRMIEGKSNVAVSDEKLFKELTDRGFDMSAIATICRTFGTEKVYHALMEVTS